VVLSISLERDVPADATVVAVGVLADDLPAGLAAVGIDSGYAEARGFTGKVGQTLTLAGRDGDPATLVVGLGPSNAVGPTVVRRAAAGLARAARREPVVAVRLLDALPEGADRPGAAQALAEGVVLGSYRFSTYKSDADPGKLERVAVVGRGGARIAAALELGAVVAGGVSRARDLVNTPGGDLTPSELADAAVGLATEHGLEVSVLDEKAIAKAGLGGLLGVNRGSTQPPRFIELAYLPTSPRGTLALVGKGITFDSGGLSLKTALGMTHMKDDMGGAAAILGAMSVLPTVAPKVSVRAYIPATDNMTGGDATRVGDVLRIRNGRTVEVLNTDAEGRLILADGLSMASEAAPDAIVDVATLTGAVEVALGGAVAGLFGNDEAWTAQVTAAADRAGERVWELPLIDDYRPWLDSEVADLKNIGKAGQAGSVVAALFLREFVGEGIPWVHLDIAGTAWSDADDLDVSKGGTGWGVRLLVELARGWRRPARRAGAA
jgi:leucyl aminopeptidase